MYKIHLSMWSQLKKCKVLKHGDYQFLISQIVKLLFKSYLKFYSCQLESLIHNLIFINFVYASKSTFLTQSITCKETYIFCRDICLLSPNLSLCMNVDYFLVPKTIWISISNMIVASVFLASICTTSTFTQYIV